MLPGKMGVLTSIRSLLFAFALLLSLSTTVNAEETYELVRMTNGSLPIMGHHKGNWARYDAGPWEMSHSVFTDQVYKANGHVWINIRNMSDQPQVVFVMAPQSSPRDPGNAYAYYQTRPTEKLAESWHQSGYVSFPIQPREWFHISFQIKSSDVPDGESLVWIVWENHWLQSYVTESQEG